MNIPVVFSSSERGKMFLKNGVFSLSRFKRLLREWVRWVLPAHIISSGSAPVSFEISRIAIRNIDPKRPKDFLLDISCSSSGNVRWRQTFKFQFNDPSRGLSGVLYSGRRRYAK